MSHYTQHISLLLLSLCFSYSLLKSQGVNPQNLFDTGLNMGYLTGHHDKSTEQPEAPIWAGNASAEWLSSWMPGAVEPITPELETPQMAHNEMISKIRQMGGCTEAYFNLRISLYQLGYTLGRGVVETGYDCASCLKSELQKASIELRTIGQLLSSQSWRDLSTELNTVAQGLDPNLSGQLAIQQNNGQFGYMQSVLNRINELLPDELIVCEGAPFQEVETDSEEPTMQPNAEKPKKRRNRKVFLTIGYTGATLKGDSGTDSQPGDGFYAGLDLAIGDPVFLLLGADFFRNRAGEEFLIPYVFQDADPGEYIQAIRIHLGLGVNAVKREGFTLSVFGNARLLTSLAIDGELLSLGDALLEDNPVHLNLGTYISFGLFTLHTSYDLGLTPTLKVVDEEMTYRIWNLGLGIRL